jgi:hypothetical protein
MLNINGGMTATSRYRRMCVATESAYVKSNESSMDYKFTVKVLSREDRMQFAADHAI